MRLRKVDTRELVHRAKNYLAQTPRARAGLSQTARAVGTSPSTLALAFRTLERISFYRYALNLRLAQAAWLLPAYDDLSRLAADSGFRQSQPFFQQPSIAGRPDPERIPRRGRSAVQSAGRP